MYGSHAFYLVPVRCTFFVLLQRSEWIPRACSFFPYFTLHTRSCPFGSLYLYTFLLATMLRHHVSTVFTASFFNCLWLLHFATSLYSILIPRSTHVSTVFSRGFFFVARMRCYPSPHTVYGCTSTFIRARLPILKLFVPVRAISARFMCLSFLSFVHAISAHVLLNTMLRHHVCFHLSLCLSLQYLSLDPHTFPRISTCISTVLTRSLSCACFVFLLLISVSFLCVSLPGFEPWTSSLFAVESSTESTQE
jgi:hypothetical protein